MSMSSAHWWISGTRPSSSKELRPKRAGSNNLHHLFSEQTPQRANYHGDKPNQQDSAGPRPSLANQPMRQMVVVPLIKRLTNSPAKEHDPNQISQRHREDQERYQHCPPPRMRGGIKMRQDCKHRQQVPHQMAPGVPQK